MEDKWRKVTCRPGVRVGAKAAFVSKQSVVGGLLGGGSRCQSRLTHRTVVDQYETGNTPRRIGGNHDEPSIFRATMSNDQRNLCQRFGAEYMPPEAIQRVGISPGSLRNLPLHAVRLSPENGTSGWYIYGGKY